MSKRRPPVAARGLIALSVMCVLAVVAAGCSNSEDDTAAPTPAQQGPTTTAAPSTFPLTGRPIDDPAKAGRAAVSVKIDNNSASRPQAGLDKADVIYEEFTEGITRFVVVFHSTDAPSIGPVRSVRPADPVIVSPLGGVFVFSGGSPAIRALVPGAPVEVVDENDTDVLKRRSGRSAPHNLYTASDGLFAKADSPRPPPALGRFLTAGAQFAAAGATPITKVNLAPAPALSAGYEWDAAAGTWKRSTDGQAHSLEGGGRLAPNNVIVQFTPYSQFSGDRKVQYPEVVGTGEAWVFAAGMMAKGRWSKPGPGAVTEFTDSAGAPIVLPPGQTFVHLVAPGSTVNPT